MGSDRITIIRGKNNGTLDWRACRRGQSGVLAEGALESGSETLPADVSGKRAGSVILALPASQIVTRIMQFPVLDAEELAGAVALQVDKFSPFPVEQMVYSYEELGKHEDKCTVLMAIAQRAAVAGWGDALRRSGTEISRVDCAALGMWHAMVGSGGIAVQRRESLLVVDADEMVLMTHDNGTLLAISGLGPSVDFGDSVACADLAEEVGRILMETDAENGIGSEPCLVVVADTGVQQVGALKRALAQVVEVPIVDYASKAFPDIVDGMIQRSGDLSSAARSLNLVPPEWVHDADALRFRKRIVLLGSGLLGLWLLLFAGGWGHLAWQRARLAQLQQLDVQWLRPANAIRGLRLQVSFIDRYRDRTHSALESLREVSAVQPQGVDLVSFTYRKGDGMEIIGEADSGDLVLEFNRRLNASALFGDVRPGTRTITRQRRHRFSFDIRFAEEAP
ncbi:MAG: PilN domain-containing protein [Kiritimatiellia bacterium]